MHARHVKFIVAGALLTAGVLVLGIVTLGDPTISMVHFTPDELLRADPAELDGRGVQVDGYVAEGSERLDASVPELRFQVRDTNKQAYIDVVYSAGLKPDSFAEGQGVVVDGQYDSEARLIRASKLVTKCPSKYEVDPEGLEAVDTGPQSADASSAAVQVDVAGSMR